jgi:hypothetical protein
MGSCEQGNVSLGSIKIGEFLDKFFNSELLKENSSPWSELIS